MDTKAKITAKTGRILLFAHAKNENFSLEEMKKTTSGIMAKMVIADFLERAASKTKRKTKIMCLH
jgi:hypothetical protein